VINIIIVYLSVLYSVRRFEARNGNFTFYPENGSDMFLRNAGCADYHGVISEKTDSS
jgi:hypothetical protein